MLDIKGVKKSYGEFQLDCSLNVEKGRITGLVGENGAGKSTLFKAVLGLISYDAGEIKILGKIPEELSEKEKEELGVVLAETGFSGYLKGKDVEAVLAKLYPKFEAEKFHQMCEEYQIPLDKFIKEYSTGMKAKLNLIIALTHQADFLMLDEPTAGLDPEERIRFRGIISELSQQKIVLLSTHIVSDLEAVANEIILLRKGVVLEMQKPALLLEHLNGQVWLVTVPAADETALTKQYTCSNVMHTDGKSVIRLLSESAPRPDAVPTAPNMEDMYLYYFGR